MKISPRVEAIQASATVVVNQKAQKLRQQGFEILNFTVGESDFPTPAPVIDATIQALKDGRTKYGSPGGGGALLEAFCKKLQRENRLDYQVDEVVAGCGAKELIFHCLLATISEGDEVILQAPYWPSYISQIKAAGGKPVIIPHSLPEQNLTVESLEKYSSPRTKGILFNTPHNPTGYVFGESELKALGAYLKAKPWWIFSDEIYEYLCFSQPHLSLLNTTPELRDRVAVITGLSKGFSMTGYRVGLMAGPKELVGAVRKLQTHSTTCLPGFIEEAATFALDQGVTLVRENLEILKDRHRVAVKLAEELPGVDFVTPGGAFYIYLDLRSWLAETRLGNERSSLEFCEKLLDQHKMAVVPGEAFGTPGFVRMSFAQEEKLLNHGFEILNQALKSPHFWN